MLGLEGGPDPIIDDRGFEFPDFQAQGHHAYLLQHAQSEKDTDETVTPLNEVRVSEGDKSNENNSDRLGPNDRGVGLTQMVETKKKSDRWADMVDEEEPSEHSESEFLSPQREDIFAGGPSTYATGSKEKQQPNNEFQRCLVPYLPLPPTPKSQPWLFESHPVNYVADRALFSRAAKEAAGIHEHPHTASPPAKTHDNQETLEPTVTPKTNFKSKSPVTHDGGPVLTTMGETPKKRNRGKAKVPDTQPRRSVRISGRSPQTKFFYKERKQSKGNGKRATAAREIKTAVEDAQVVQALQQEVLNSEPLRDEQVNLVEGYYGFKEGPPLETAIPRGPVQREAERMDDEEESNLAALQYDPSEYDFTDEEEDEVEDLARP